MDITIEKTEVYSFDDLAEEVKIRVLENYRHEFDDYKIFERGIVTDFKERQYHKGFVIDEVQYSGFYGQGEGASFTGYVMLKDFIKKKELQDYYHLLPFIAKGYIGLFAEIKRHPSHYPHELTGYVGEIGIRIEDHPRYKRVIKRLSKACKCLQAEIEKVRLSLCRQVYNRLKSEYDYRRSDEYTKLVIDARAFLFNKNGDRVDHLTD